MTDLVPQILNDLARSGLTLDDAKAARWRPTTDASVDVHPAIRKGTQGLVIPYYDVDRQPMKGRDGRDFARVKTFNEPEAAKGFAKAKGGPKYIQGPDTGVHAYFPLIVPWRDVIAEKKPIVITEGEKKSEALATYGVPCIGLGGVFNFVEQNGFLPELADLPWSDLRVYLSFDSDATHNEWIKEAERRLLRELSTLRGADVRLVRMPEPPPTIDENGKKKQTKAGIDDYLVAHGIDGYLKLLESAQEMSRLDREVLALNERLAWIEDQDKALEIATGIRYTRASLVSGGKFASMKYTKVLDNAKKGGGRAVTVRVPQEWLEHELRRGYDGTVFLPKDDVPVVFDDLGRSLLNTWSGYREREGDVSIFTELTDFIFSELPDDLRDFPLKLMAYKAQNPHLKVPIALLFVGEEGSGKSVWGTCIAAAFAPYSQVFDAKVLASDYNSFIENNLVACVNELNGNIARDVAPTLRTLVADELQNMNEKYLVAKQVRSYTMFILNANDHGAGSFGHDDRRFFLIPTPSQLQSHHFYDRVFSWLRGDNNSAGKAIMHYLLSYDLQGWRPPVKAPSTQEKAAARDEGYNFVQQLAADMKKSDQNIVHSWMVASQQWAQERATNPDKFPRDEYLRSVDILANFPTMAVRPWYTASELLILFPYLADHVLHYRGSGHKSLTPGQLSRWLRNAGIPLLRNKSPGGTEGFLMNNKRQQFLLVSGHSAFAGGLTDEQFAAHMRAMTLFKDYRGN